MADEHLHNESRKVFIMRTYEKWLRGASAANVYQQDELRGVRKVRASPNAEFRNKRTGAAVSCLG